MEKIFVWPRAGAKDHPCLTPDFTELPVCLLYCFSKGQFPVSTSVGTQICSQFSPDQCLAHPESRRRRCISPQTWFVICKSWSKRLFLCHQYYFKIYLKTYNAFCQVGVIFMDCSLGVAFGSSLVFSNKCFQMFILLMTLNVLPKQMLSF